MSRLGISGDAIRSNIAATAATPISRQGCTVVRGTVKRLAYWTSSMPTIRTSSGISVTQLDQGLHDLAGGSIIGTNNRLRFEIFDRTP
jgi:hypothetical protein